MAEHKPATQVRAAAALYGQSEAQVLRDAIDAGLSTVLRKYAKDAGMDSAVAAAELVRLGTEIETKRAEVRAKKEHTRARTHSRQK
jgi:hypothetical protein